MKKILINGLAYVDGRAAGFNNYFKSIVTAISKNLDNDIELTILIRSDQRAFFCGLSKNIKIKTFNCRNLFERLIKENIYLPIFACYYDLTIFPANISPVLMFSKYILIVCDLNFTKFPSNFSFIHLLLRNTFQRLCIRRASACIAISHEVQIEIFNYAGVHADVIYVPIDVSDINRNQSSINECFKTIIIPTSLAVHKNVLACYEAALEIVEEFRGIKFIFFGGWKISSFPRDKEHPKVELLGWVADEQRRNLLSNCNALLVPSIYEGFGMPYIEALILGIPLVCSDIPIAREVVDENAYFINLPYQKYEIISALRELISNEFKPHVVSQESISKFSLESIGKKYSEVINRYLV